MFNTSLATLTHARSSVLYVPASYVSRVREQRSRSQFTSKFKCCQEIDDQRGSLNEKILWTPRTSCGIMYDDEIIYETYEIACNVRPRWDFIARMSRKCDSALDSSACQKTEGSFIDSIIYDASAAPQKRFARKIQLAGRWRKFARNERSFDLIELISLKQSSKTIDSMIFSVFECQCYDKSTCSTGNICCKHVFSLLVRLRARKKQRQRKTFART